MNLARFEALNRKIVQLRRMAQFTIKSRTLNFTSNLLKVYYSKRDDAQLLHSKSFFRCVLGQ